MKAKKLTLANLKKDNACVEGVDWIKPFLKLPQADIWARLWLDRPQYHQWALDMGYTNVATAKDYVALVQAELKDASTGHYAHNASTGDSAHNASTGDSAHNASTGPCAHNASTGDSAHNASTGPYAHNASTGDSAHNASTGPRARNASTGDSAHNASTGPYAHNASTGDSAHNASTGDSAHNAARGKKSICAALGENSLVMAVAPGSLLIACYSDAEGFPKAAVGTVGKDGIKPGVWYKADPATGTLVKSAEQPTPEFGEGE